eukprot:TRINITY_DN4250_c0_g1_i1.p1 TRINITY_DN4250_c0_g1~~TRINITY_DN4250_c0_g1_i1.p1  ORF type:complete len:529 (-),score=58.01 TRINITY_DN4250_c0_g1_i1:145-1731(-)
MAMLRLLGLLVLVARTMSTNENIPSMPFVPDYGLGATGNPMNEARYVVGQRFFYNDGDWEVRTLSGRHLVLGRLVSEVLYKVYTVEPHGFSDGAATTARFWGPQGLALHNGKLGVADTKNHVFRLVDVQTGVASTVGRLSAENHTAQSGFVDGAAPLFSSPAGVCFDQIGTSLFVADTHNHAIRKVNVNTGVAETIAGGQQGFANAYATQAMFSYPTGVVVTHNEYSSTETACGSCVGLVRVLAGTLFVVDQNNHQIRRINPDGSVHTHAGSIAGHKDGFSNYSKFHSPVSLAIHHATGDLYVADSTNHKIRKVDFFGSVTTIAGSTIGDHDSIDALSARFNFPFGVTVTQTTNPDVYFTDRGNSRVRALHLIDATTPAFYPGSKKPAGKYRSATVAGSVPGWLDGQGNWSQMHLPAGIQVQDDGTIYIADSSNNVLRQMQLKTDATLCRVHFGTCEPGKRQCESADGVLCSYAQESCLDTDSCRCSLLYHSTTCNQENEYSYNSASHARLSLASLGICLSLAWLQVN